jgi:hypothetical protein
MTPQQQRAVERLAEQLENMSQQGDQAARDEKNAERLREQAQRLYENASPEQRERMQRWAQQMARNPSDGDTSPAGDRRWQGSGNARREGSTLGGGDPRRNATQATAPPIRTEPIDARARTSERDGNAEQAQVVAEWLGRGDERRVPGSPLPDSAAVQNRLREAARSAEQAIGERTVPGRYDRILREYFRRLPAKLADPSSPEASPGLAPAAEPAADGASGGGR